LSNPLVVLTGVNKHFGALHVLKDVDLTVDRGEVVVVIGPSGSGKSTLCRPSTGWRPSTPAPSRSTASRCPPRASSWRSCGRRSGWCFQSFNLFAHKTVLENVTLGPIKVKSVKKATPSARRELLERVGIASQADKYPAQLSGGSSSASPSPGRWPWTRP
jgi:glutamate transport system ATP-binding protein